MMRASFLLLLGLGLAAARATAAPPPAGQGKAAPAPTARPLEAWSQEELAALVKKVDGESVIDVAGKHLLVLARRPGPELAYGEPKHVALAVDREGRVTAELDVAWGVGDEGTSVERTWDYPGAGVLRLTTSTSNCSLESQYQECSRSVAVELHRLTDAGTFERLDPAGRYCDRATGEELELLVEPEDAGSLEVVYRSRRRPGARKLAVVSKDARLTTVVVRFAKGDASYRLVLRDDYSSLTSSGSDGSPAQTFVRGECAR